MRKRIASTLIVTVFAVAPVAAQDNADDLLYNHALAAGYKAQFTCSGLWNGGKTLENITRDELTGIYPRIASIVPTLKTEIDETERQVKVTYADNAPPRIAVWNRRTGCTSLPVGFGGIKTGAAVKLRDFHDELPWPMGDANAVSPDKAMNALALQAVNGSFGGKTSAALVMRGGKIMGEAYMPGHDKHTGQRTWSVAKSIAGTLIGHAVLSGGIDVKKPVQVPEWQSFGDSRKTITLDNLMRMASGLYSDTAGNRTDPIYMGAASVGQRSTSWPLIRRPGTYFRYANNDTLMAVRGAQAQYDGFDPYAFFRAIGMTRTYAETDWQDNYILSSQVWTTARDLTRLGQLYLNNGIWKNARGEEQRLLPESWRAYVAAPSGPQPDRRFGYGATFWLMNKSEGIPADTFAGFGNRGQYLIIIPSMDMVIVRRGYDTREARFNIEEFTRQIVAESQ
ncbi:serine hydrolase [Sphingorhabdus sp. Alg239-R122]|uniref:serine hydrolase domain-containing protein n=1 Tax=Sphingorhabdus sp. Alg239-R122 TaxID=2305989 RepID=UPI0013D9283A|nr:serine hydrolase [Sphingorhabdus sp. Alg239-R122]